jgi:hypothetical protein
MRLSLPLLLLFAIFLMNSSASVAQDSTPAKGIATFFAIPIAPYDFPIPEGTLILSINRPKAVEFKTTATVTMRGGARRVSVPIEAIGTGDCGNVPAGISSDVISGIIVPVTVKILAPTRGGSGSQCLASR